MKITHVEIEIPEGWALVQISNVWRQLARSLERKRTVAALAECFDLKSSLMREQFGSYMVTLCFSSTDPVRSVKLFYNWLHGVGRITGTWEAVPAQIGTTIVIVADKRAPRGRREIKCTLLRAFELYAAN